MITSSRALLICTCAISLALAASSAPTAPVPRGEERPRSDHVMFGGTPSRNMVNLIDKNVPETFEPVLDAMWMAELESRSSGGPVVAGGKVFVGANNERPRNNRDTMWVKGKAEPIDYGILMCLDQRAGDFLWQAVHPKLDGQVRDWPKQGVCSTPTVEGDRIYYVSNRGTVVCADVNGQGGRLPGIERKSFSDRTDARLLWEYDMIRELGVFPHAMSACLPLKSGCSPLLLGDMVFVVTGNGVDEGHIIIPSPEAPSFIALDKNSGKLLWKSNAPGRDVMHGQWSNPTYAVIGGVRQVIFPGGDGWLYSFVPETGELIWKFDCNPKDAKHEIAGTGSRSDFVGTPVIYDERVYIGTGQDPEHTTGPAYFFCIAPTRRGDVSKTIIDGRDKDGKPINERANPNSCEVWRYGGPENRKFAPFDFTFGRTASTACIVDDVVYISEVAGYLHCLNARTGEHYWRFDAKGSVFASPYYVDGKVLLGNDAGELFVFRHLKNHQVFDEVKAAAGAADKIEAKKLRNAVYKQLASKYLLSKIEFDAPIRSTTVVANGVLYVVTDSRLYAIKCAK